MSTAQPCPESTEELLSAHYSELVEAVPAPAPVVAREGL